MDIKNNIADWDLQFEGIKAIIAEPFVKKYTDFFDIQTMAARLHNKESMSSEFKLKEGSWFLSMIVPQSYDKNGNVNAIFTKITEEGKVYVAEYNENGTLLSIKSDEISDSVIIPFTCVNKSKVKVFIWKNDMKPLFNKVFTLN